MLALVASSARAEEAARSFNELRLRVRLGDTVTVIDQGGRELRGEITELSPVSLRLLAAGSVTDLGEIDVRRVSRQRRFRRKGALWGMAIGVGFGVALGSAVARERELGGPAGGVQVFTGLTIFGTGAGLGVGSLLTRQQVIFDR